MTQSEVLAELAADEAKLKPYWTARGDGGIEDVTDFKAPWEYDDNLRAIFDAGGTSVAFLPNQHDPARARLLLAAPALHAALKELLDYTINQLYGGEYEMGTNVELDAPMAALGMVAEIEGGGT